nr:unnamed protein product [Callosobruchus analis]
MVDLGGYVIILVETKDKKIKLYGKEYLNYEPVFPRKKKLYTPEQLLLLYKAQIRPSLEYCSHVWGCAPKHSLKLLDSIQNRAVKLIDTDNLTKDLHSLQHRRRVAGLSLFCRFYHGRCSSELSQIITPKAVRTRNTRDALHAHPYQVEVPTPRTSLLQHSFFWKTSTLWNELPGRSPADKDNLEVGDEILEVNGKTLEDATHTEVINHIHQLYDRSFRLSYLEALRTTYQQGVFPVNGRLAAYNPFLRTAKNTSTNDKPVALPNIISKVMDNNTHNSNITNDRQYGFDRTTDSLTGLSEQLTFSFLRSSGLKSETEGFIMACQDGVVNALVYRGRVMGMNVPDTRCRACRQRQRRLCISCRHVRHEIPVLPYAPGDIESVVENERCRIYCTTLELVQANKPDTVLLDHQQKTMFVIEFSAPAEVNSVSKEEEKRTKYQELLGQLRRLWPDYTVSLLVMVMDPRWNEEYAALCLRQFRMQGAVHILAAECRRQSPLDKAVPANRPDIVFQSKADRVTYLIDIVIPNDKNVQDTYTGKISKYTDLAIEIKRLWKQNKVIMSPYHVGLEPTQQTHKNYTPLNLSSHVVDTHNHIQSQEKIETWSQKALHGKHRYRVTQDYVNEQQSYTWLHDGQLFPETEGFMLAILDQVIVTLTIIAENVTSKRKQ